MEQLMNKAMIDAHKIGTVHEFDIVGSFSSSSSSSVSGISSGSSLESDSFEEVTSPASSSSSSSSDHQLSADPLSDMSSLFEQLPIKRGLSKHYQGKSQSFTSLANVKSLEDLAKAENPYNKRLKSCKSYGGRLAESHKTKCTHSNTMSRHGSKRGLHSACSRGSRGSANFMRPPIPTHRSTSTTNITNQTALFA
ncbi:protein OXIDATIVE STRESS 3-like [Gastrolobium bilobum]|uniref:protein OXIDATIVE STRESS 3-like n=1 Tax=Gastrolobium bilobum TaxID=150636 RepID=UPI002AB05202|nr:protein OXIDATIVE STRESS 3-like [Gastrolobium bilobum]